MNSSEIKSILDRHSECAEGPDNGKRANLQGANLHGAHLQGAHLQDANLQVANLRGACLQGAYLRGADLRRADLQGAYLRGADLRRADLQGAYLQGAYLQDADLQGADLQDANLRGADLQRADLRGADLRHANLQDSDLQGAYLQGADFLGELFQVPHIVDFDSLVLANCLLLAGCNVKCKTTLGIATVAVGLCDGSVGDLVFRRGVIAVATLVFAKNSKAAIPFWHSSEEAVIKLLKDAISIGLENSP